MKRLLSLFASAFIYFSVASMLTLSVGVGVFVMKGGLSGDKKLQVMAVLNGLDLHDFWTKLESASLPQREEQMSYEEVLEGRVRAGLDWDMRERAIQRGMNDLRSMESAFVSNRGQFEAERKKFIADLQQQQEQVENVALQELQDTLNALSPKQAKEHIKMWLENSGAKYPLPGRDVVADVVTLMKSFTPDRLSKITKEFKDDDDKKMLHNILERIRIGPQEELIQKTRDKLDDAASVGSRTRR